MSYNPFGNIGVGGGGGGGSASGPSASRLPLPPPPSSSSSSSQMDNNIISGGAGGALSNLIYSSSSNVGVAGRQNQQQQQQQQRQQQQQQQQLLQHPNNSTIISGVRAGGLIGGNNLTGISNPSVVGSGAISTMGGSSILTGNNSGNSGMNNVPPSLRNVGGGGNNNINSNNIGSINNIGNPATAIRPADELHTLVLQLIDRDQREGALLELSKRRESFPDLAPILWHTVGCVAALLQEIASIYPSLAPPTLAAHASNRVCNALALLQCVASHPDTRSLFLAAHVPLYLYPFLNTQSKSRPFEYLRLTSLGVVGALVKMDDADVINFLLQTEIIPLCLRIMESGSELSKTVATFIVQKILLDDVGLGYVCATAERFYAVSTVLNNMVAALASSPSVRLLKHIVRCYLRLSDNTRARDALRQALPASLRDDTFAAALRDDVTVKKWLGQLLSVVGPPDQSLPQGAQASGGMTGGGGGVNGGGGGQGTMGGPRLAIASVGGGGAGGDGVDS
jgi:CCR4-NOT transcription complex subunit 9